MVVVVFVNKEPTDETTTTTTSNPTDPSQPTNPPIPPAAITLEDILDNKLYARRNNATWISDTELLYRNTNVSIFDWHCMKAY